VKVVVLLVTFLLFLIVSKAAWSVTVNITNFPVIVTDEPFTLTASISGATAGTNYLRVDIFKESTSNYFGETFNGSDWYGGSSFTSYYPISIQSGVFWSGSLQGRVGSPTQTEYDSQGTYKIRLRRYTSGGGTSSSEANLSSVPVSIVFPTQTPTPLPPTNTPTPTPTLKPTPTTVSKQLVAKTSPIQQVLKSETESKIEKGVSTSTALFSFETEKNKEKKSQKKQTIVLSDQLFTPKIFVVIGILILILCAIVILGPIIGRKIRNNENY
jgi:hypothetical protein